MHESSLVRSLLGQVETIRIEQNGLAVDEVRIEIGPLSGVEPLLVHSAFSELAPACGMIGARLVIDDVPLSARCSQCGLVEVTLARISCPACGSQDVRIGSGDEVRLQSVTIRQAHERETTK
ncbi:MAG: hydrogenase maturation nickel metallochaperone HypA [Planctomycetaceae bacterium]|nr:hydrogenase maturation nickel metallochaperone HypA [Planctomycetaceae bacterium]